MRRRRRNLGPGLSNRGGSLLIAGSRAWKRGRLSELDEVNF